MAAANLSSSTKFPDPENQNNLEDLLLSRERTKKKIKKSSQDYLLL